MVNYLKRSSGPHLVLIINYRITNMFVHVFQWNHNRVFTLAYNFGHKNDQKLFFDSKIWVGRPWPNRYSSCTTNVYNLDDYAGAHGFNPRVAPVCVWGAKSLRIDGGL